jgi:hypothetical protein
VIGLADAPKEAWFPAQVAARPWQQAAGDGAPASAASGGQHSVRSAAAAPPGGKPVPCGVCAKGREGGGPRDTSWLQEVRTPSGLRCWSDVSLHPCAPAGGANSWQRLRWKPEACAFQALRCGSEDLLPPAVPAVQLPGADVLHAARRGRGSGQRRQPVCDQQPGRSRVDHTIPAVVNALCVIGHHQIQLRFIPPVMHWGACQAAPSAHVL